MAKKIVLSHSDLARVASGVPIAQVEHREVEADPGTETPPDPVEPAAAASMADPTPVVEASGEPTVTEPTMQDPAESQSVSDMVSFLRTELDVARTQVAELQVAKLQLETQLSDASANSEGLLQCALHGAGLLQVMLGQIPVSLEGLPASTVASQYGKYRQAYESRFVVGQQSLGAGEARTEEPTGDAAALRIGLRPVG